MDTKGSSLMADSEKYDVGPEHTPEPDWKTEMNTGGIQFMPSEPWGTVHEVEPKMGWPEAASNMVIVTACSAVLIVLFLVLWGPW